VGGTKLLVTDWPNRRTARRLQITSDDATELVLGDGADPMPLMASGGLLRVVAIGGDGFDETYLLDPEGWQPIDRRNPRVGLRYRDPDGPITKILFRANTRLRISGKGPQLGQSLTIEPDFVQVVLQLGGYEYCFTFGGTTKEFAPGRRLIRRSALRPLACPDDYAALEPVPAP
jgi:hypothetical protein